MCSSLMRIWLSHLVSSSGRFICDSHLLRAIWLLCFCWSMAFSQITFSSGFVMSSHDKIWGRTVTNSTKTELCLLVYFMIVHYTLTFTCVCSSQQLDKLSSQSAKTTNSGGQASSTKTWTITLSHIQRLSSLWKISSAVHATLRYWSFHCSTG